MRREILFPLLGFLGGFVVAAFVFWQPAASSEPGAPAAAATKESAPKAVAVETGVPEHGRRPMVMAASESAGPLPVVEGTQQAKAPAELLHELVGKVKGLDQTKRQAAIDNFVKQLRAAGPEGMQVLREYFRAGQDVKFQGGYSMVNGKVVQSPSLRAALLNSLEDWTGPEAVELTREILRTTPRMSEASLAINQLEKKAPGVYRQEAIQTLQQLAAAPPDKDGLGGFTGTTPLFEGIKQFKATELLPAAEAFVTKNPGFLPQFAASVEALPADVRSAAYQRLFANEAVTKSLTANPWALQSLNYSEPVVAQKVTQVFAANTDKKFRENFLQNLVNVQSFAYGMGQVGVAADASANRTSQLQGRLAVLEQIAPLLTTPVLQERLQDARTDIQKAIANPQKAPGGAQNTIFMGGGGTAIGSVIPSDATSGFGVQIGK